MGFFQKRQEKSALRKLKKGNQEAFIWFYDQFASPIYRFIYLKINSSQDSEDLTSETFFKFWQSARNGLQIRNPRALLYQIARNLVIDFYRQKPRADLAIDPAANDDILAKIDDGIDLNRETEMGLNINMVKKAIGQLKAEYQDVLVWYYLEELSAKEISQILDKPEGTVRVLIHRALTALKKAVGQEGDAVVGSR